MRRPTAVMKRALAATITAVCVLVPAPAAQAASLTQDARELRTSVVQLTMQYEQAYGDRVDAGARAELRTMAADARRQLGALVTAIRTAERTGAASDWRSAQALHTSGTIQAGQRFERARTLLQPHLGLGEQLRALSDYSTTMKEFELLGQRISAKTDR